MGFHEYVMIISIAVLISCIVGIIIQTEIRVDINNAIKQQNAINKYDREWRDEAERVFDEQYEWNTKVYEILKTFCESHNIEIKDLNKLK